MLPYLPALPYRKNLPTYQQTNPNPYPYLPSYLSYQLTYLRTLSYLPSYQPAYVST